MGEAVVDSELPVSRVDRGPPKKRRRIVVSCIECHRRKQKCDRELPCANCRSRNREAFCSYDPSAPTARDTDLNKVSPGENSEDSPSAAKNDESLSSMAASWGYAQTGPSTIGFLKKIEMAEASDEDATSGLPARDARQDTFAVREKYKGLIRQLPAKVFIDKLVVMFMQEFNWQYYFVDPDIFAKQLKEWNSLPFSIFSAEGPQGISPDLRVFPAVLFQMIATALLILPDGAEPEFATLKYASNMTFEDLARDYSESGANIINLFGKKTLSTTTVVAEFLRASFLKFTANVTESWHMIGIAIRDAQELGMHRDSLDPKPAGTSVESVLENQWHIERRRRLYMTLTIWDINMCLILGRPGSIDWRHGIPSLPADSPAPLDRSTTPVVPRNPDKDLPTPLTRSLWLAKLTGPLREIQDLEQDGPYPKDFTNVDRVQHSIMSLNESKSAIFRLENPDSRWDSHPSAHWIPGTRYYFESLHEFSLMALHRPYVFHRQESRNQALRASLAMLEIQRRTFEGSSPASWRNFMLFFGTFDAVVLIASIYILYPSEHAEQRSCSMQHLHWAIERFATMQDQNPLANAAQGVLKAILDKFTKALAASASTGPMDDSSATPSSTRGTSDATPASTSSKVQYHDSIISDEHRNGPMSKFGYNEHMPPGENWAVPTVEELATIMPTFPTSDLIFNDLTAARDESGMPPSAMMPLAAEPPLAAEGLSWQFGGDIGQGTLWQILNDF